MASSMLKFCVVFAVISGILCGPNWRQVSNQSRRVLSSARYAARRLNAELLTMLYTAYSKEITNMRYLYSFWFVADWGNFRRRRCFAIVDFKLLPTGGISRSLLNSRCLTPW